MARDQFVPVKLLAICGHRTVEFRRDVHECNALLSSQAGENRAGVAAESWKKE